MDVIADPGYLSPKGSPKTQKKLRAVSAVCILASLRYGVTSFPLWKGFDFKESRSKEETLFHLLINYPNNNNIVIYNSHYPLRKCLV